MFFQQNMILAHELRDIVYLRVPLSGNINAKKRINQTSFDILKTIEKEICNSES
jgi:hypothetical protein